MSTSRDYVAGQVLTAAQADDWAQGVLGRGFSNSNVGPTSGAGILDIISASAVTIAATNRLIKVTIQWRSLVGATDPGIYLVMIREGSTLLNAQAKKIETTGTGQQGGTMIHWIASPSAAAHTYKMSLQRASGTGTATVEADPTYPIQILVEDCGTA